MRHHMSRTYLRNTSSLEQLREYHLYKETLSFIQRKTGVKSIHSHQTDANSKRNLISRNSAECIKFLTLQQLLFQSKHRVNFETIRQADNEWSDNGKDNSTLTGRNLQQSLGNVSSHLNQSSKLYRAQSDLPRGRPESSSRNDQNDQLK